MAVRQRRPRSTVSQAQPPQASPASKVRVEYLDLTSLNPYQNNPRDNEQAVESVKNSIESFGFLVPIVVDKDHVIVAGHTRYEAAKRLGLTEAPCIVASYLSQAQIDAFRLIDNKVSELARWNFDKLSAELTYLQDSGIEFTRYGWTQEEIDCLREVVSDDCMAAGAMTQLDSRERGRHAEQRAPAQSRFVLAEFVFFIPQDTMRRWASEVRVEGDYDETEITRILKERLGIDVYEEAGRT
jgi:hypothetical protein